MRRLNSEGHEGRFLFDFLQGVVVDDLLGHAPLLERFVKLVEAERPLALFEVVLQLKVLLQLSPEVQELIEDLDVAIGQLEGEGLVVRLLTEVLVNFLSAKVEEPSQLLHMRPVVKQLLELQLRPVLGVVAHQELAQEDARVKPFPN